MAKDRYNRARIHNNHDGFWTGLVLLLVGGALLLQKMNLGLPHWLFTWPMILIVVGVVTGIKHSFRNPSWLVLVGIGGFFLFDDIMADVNLKTFFWPIVIIGAGLLFMLRPKRKFEYPKEFNNPDAEFPVAGSLTNPDSGKQSSAYMSGEDVLDSVSIFGGVKKVVTSKNFKGGDIVCFMGGAEINLSQADIQGPVTIELFQAFGGTKLVVPPHWEIRSEAVAIFAGIEDKRPPQPGVFDPNKILIINGTTIFGGIEIKSF